MKTIIQALIILLTLTSCAQEKTNNTSTQILTWGGKAAVGNYAPEGTLEVKNIESQIEDKTIKSLKVTIDMKSLYQENKRLMNHLREKDFFDVKKYPEASFTLTEAFVVGSSKYLVGTMTIKDKTQLEEIPVETTIENGSLKLTFNHTMNRLDYGITFNSPTVFEKIKENAIADIFSLRGTLVDFID